MTVKNIKKKSSRQKCRNYELTIGFFTQLLQKKFNVLGYSILFVLTSGGGGNSLIWAIEVCATSKGMVLSHFDLK